MTTCDLSEPSWTSNHWENRALKASPSWKLFTGLNSSWLFLPSDHQVLLTHSPDTKEAASCICKGVIAYKEVLLKILLKGKHQIVSIVLSLSPGR